jgi:hypothetical protein
MYVLNLALFPDPLKTIFPTISQKIGSKVPNDTVRDPKDTVCIPPRQLRLKPNR